MLADPEVDTVDICTPPSTHSDLIVKAAEAGKNIICEKPITDDMEGARRAVEAADKHGVTLGVMQNYRYRPEYVDAQKYLSSQMLGRPFFASMEGFFHWNGGSYRKRTERMLIIEMAYHYIDLLRFLLSDDIVKVYAVAGRSEASPLAGETWSTITMNFSRGAAATILCSAECYGVAANWGGSAVVQCTEGTMEINRKQFYSLNMYSAGGGGQYPLVEYPKDAYSVHMNAPFTLPLQTFFQAVQEGKKAPVSGRDNLNTLAAALMCYESMDKQQPVEVTSL
jgi:UDP-N-acetyl-2-amino-2-deoxyglucuronate dehydrogenase